MSGVPDDPAGQEEPGVPDVPPFQVGSRMFDHEYADDFRGNISALELTEAEEDYRHRAHEAVLHYAGDYGLQLFPVWWVVNGACACRDGSSCMSAGKHPVDLRWPETATSDPERAARWWRTLEPGETLPVDWRPRANIAAMMGEKHFIFDVDTDSGKVGEQSLATLVSEHDGEDLPDTLVYQTGGGGRQHVMRIPEGIEVRSSASKIAPDLDVKGVRSYGILPPSVSGKGLYCMRADRSPDALPPAWLADWLTGEHRQRTGHIRALSVGDQRQIPRDGLTPRAHAYITAALSDASAKVATAENGKRNQTLNDESFDLFAKFGRAGFLSADDIAAAMSDAAEACGLDDKAIYATVRSAARGGQIKDRTAELPDFLFEVPGQEHPALDKPEPLTERDTPWLPRGPDEACTGLDPDGRVPLDGDVKKDSSPRDVLRLAWAVALGHASPHVVVLGRDLVVVSGGEQGSLDIGELDATRLRSLCAEGDLTYIHHVETVKDDDDDGSEVLEEWDEPVLPSLQLCRTALAIPAIRLYRPVLAGITSVPVLRPEPEVSLLEVQGVDAATSMIYWPTLPVGTIPARPDRSEVAAARKLLLDELLHDFPWSSPADKANCLAMWLTSYLQAFGQYLSPLFVLNAAKSSSGKSFLVTVMVETTGAYFRTWVNDEAEIRKALTACLMESDPCIVFDDIGKRDTVASATLASALTKRQWDDRILGISKNFRGTNNRTWCLTGNNVRLGGDIPSRSVLIHLDPGPGDPKERDVTKFKLGDISVWLAREENKVRIIRALLILIADWAAHGCPRSAVQHRFAEWAAIAGGVLEHHKVDGFLDNQALVEQHVHYDEHLGDFFRRWHELHGDEPQGVKKLRATLGKDAERGNDLLWKGHWPRGRKNELLSWKALGQELREALSQVHDGYQVDVVSDGHGGELFKVSPVEEPVGEQKESSQSQL